MVPFKGKTSLFALSGKNVAKIGIFSKIGPWKSQKLGIQWWSLCQNVQKYFSTFVLKFLFQKIGMLKIIKKPFSTHTCYAIVCSGAKK